MRAQRTGLAKAGRFVGLLVVLVVPGIHIRGKGEDVAVQHPWHRVDRSKIGLVWHGILQIPELTSESLALDFQSEDKMSLFRLG